MVFLLDVLLPDQSTLDPKQGLTHWDTDFNQRGGNGESACEFVIVLSAYQSFDRLAGQVGARQQVLVKPLEAT